MEQPKEEMKEATPMIKLHSHETKAKTAMNFLRNVTMGKSDSSGTPLSSNKPPDSLKPAAGLFEIPSFQKKVVSSNDVPEV